MSSVSGVFIVVVMRGMWVKSQELDFYYNFHSSSITRSIIIDHKIFFDFEFGGGPSGEIQLIVSSSSPFKIDTPPNRSSMRTFPT